MPDISQINAPLLDPRGRILVAGNFQEVNGIRLPHDGGLVRFNADGTFDESFVPFLENSPTTDAIALEVGGHILVLVTCGALLRLEERGALGPLFKADLGPIACARLVAAQPGGKLLVSGATKSSGLGMIDLLGASTDSTVRVFVCFFLGLALSSACAAALIPRIKRPWRFLAEVEAGVAVTYVPFICLPQVSG